MREDVEQARELGHDAHFLDRDAVRAEVDSPTYLAGAWHRDRIALVDPARLAWGLRAACLQPRRAASPSGTPVDGAQPRRGRACG